MMPDSLLVMGMLGTVIQILYVVNYFSHQITNLELQYLVQSNFYCLPWFSRGLMCRYQSIIKTKRLVKVQLVWMARLWLLVKIN